MVETTDSDAVDGMLSTSMVDAATVVTIVNCESSDESEGEESS